MLLLFLNVCNVDCFMFCRLDMDLTALDPDVTIMYSSRPSHVKKINRYSLQARLSSCYNRKPMPEPYESKINSIWLDRVSKNPTLWNGTKFRIASVDEANECVIFNLGITSYKEFIGTNWSPDAQLYRQLGNMHHNNTQAGDYYIP
jgi:hypothetical protein